MDTKPADTKQRILDTAFRLFARDGYGGVTVRELTKAAGVNQAAVNYHFGSKEALFGAVAEGSMTEIAERLRRVLAGPEPYRERFHRAVHALVDDVLSNARWARLMIRELLAGTHRLPVAADRQVPQLVQHLRAFLAEGVQQGHLREHDSLLGAASVMSLLGWMVVVQDRLREVSGIDVSDASFRHTLAEHHAMVLWRGLVRQEGPP